MKCSFNRLLYPKTPEEAQEGGRMIAIFIPREKVLDAQGERITSIKVVGYYLPTTPYLVVDMTGRWKKDPRFGLQFEMASYEEVIGSGKQGFVSYLSSGLFKGIGKRLAERIYDTFGEDTLRILDTEPERISEVPGLSKKKQKQFVSVYQQTRGARRVITMLAPLDVSANQAARIQKQLGPDAERILRQFPYQAYEDGLLDFPTVDRLASMNGIPRTAPERVDASLLYTLELAEHKGDLCIRNDHFIRQAMQTLDTPQLTRESIAQRAYAMLNDRRLVLYGDYTYRAVMAKAETGTAMCVREMLTRKNLPYMGDLDDAINNQQTEMGFTFAQEQRNAIKAALTSPLCIISGGPGTGKTSIQRAILRIYADAFPAAKIVCCAPTGRAARRMEQSTGFASSTVHKALNLQVNEFNYLELPEQLDADFVLVDEVSMIDMVMAWYLFNAIPPECRLVLVGDADQLPSVGPGAVLRELIRCGRIPVVMLDKVFRQDEGSMIAVNAQKIKHGDTNLFPTGVVMPEDAFQFWSSSDIRQSADWLIHLYAQEVARYGLDNVVLLTPFRKKTETGVRALNERLQALINPPAPDKPELTVGKRTFRLGDKVMQTQNRMEVSNGDIGYVERIEKDPDGFVVEVNFGDDRVVLYEETESLSRLELAYASTIHKSQGAEFDSVLLNIQHLHRRMLKCPLIYTAITRARRKVAIIGDWDAVLLAIETKDTEQRCTQLAARIAAPDKLLIGG